MKKIFKWIGIILGSLIILVLVAAVGLSVAGASRLNKTYDIQATNITIPTDEAALARGEHLVNVFCRDCHTADLSGQLFFEEPPIGTIYAPNLTGLADKYNDQEIILAIRHGLDSAGQPLLIMPSESFVHFSEEDLGAVIAYLKTVRVPGKHCPKNNFAPLVGF
jgi:mono/diheme cytochrome c family protein